MDAAPAAIPALTPRGSGHQFVVYADSCLGAPGEMEVHLLPHRRVVEAIRRLNPPPEFVSFPGDAVMDGAYAEQWAQWFAEMAWTRELGIDILQSTSNHNTHDPESVRQFRLWWASVPQNGPAGQRGLAYWVRRGDLLYVSLHQPDSQAAECMQRGISHQESAWLESVLEVNKDARTVLVAGHYPVFPVNGYAQSPLWCFVPAARDALWDILVRHGVTAYLCSHVIAFDIQIHRGIPQITTGGAGTQYGPGGFMPGPDEYHHAVQVAIDDAGLHFQVIDARGTVREAGAWPIPEPPHNGWQPAESIGDVDGDILFLSIAESPEAESGHRDFGWSQPNQEAIWLAATDDDRLQIGVDAITARPFARISLDGIGAQTWHGPEIDLNETIAFELALHPGFGPGGVLCRFRGDQSWTSMTSASSRGVSPDVLYEGPLHGHDGFTVRAQSIPLTEFVPRMSAITTT